MSDGGRVAGNTEEGGILDGAADAYIGGVRIG